MLLQAGSQRTREPATNDRTAQEVERIVNEKIQENLSVISKETPLQEALDLGAQAEWFYLRCSWLLNLQRHTFHGNQAC